ncbi:MAG: hypothetical protein JWN34_3179 [Bryobacterales bacterium]|jgi:hypothetical protein|nr:hypothetical protein [Bryobacterales bacterium]
MRGLLLAGAIILAATGQAEIIDRISVRVGTRMITASEIDLRVRLTAFENREKPELSVERRKQAVEQLIDQRIVEHEMDIGRYPRLEPSEKTELMVAFAGERFGADAGALGSALAAYGITPDELESDLARQQDLITFLGLRFRLGTDLKKADAELDEWLTEQRKRTGVEYLEKELEP